MTAEHSLSRCPWHQQPGRGGHDLTSAARSLRDLLDPLERDAEEVGSVPDTEAQIVDEVRDRIGGGCRRFGSNQCEAGTRAATPAYGRERIARQSDVIARNCAGY